MVRNTKYKSLEEEVYVHVLAHELLVFLGIRPRELRLQLLKFILNFSASLAGSLLSFALEKLQRLGGRG